MTVPENKILYAIVVPLILVSLTWPKDKVLIRSAVVCARCAWNSKDAPLPTLGATPEQELQENKTDNFGDAHEASNTTPSDDPFSSAFDAL